MNMHTSAEPSPTAPPTFDFSKEKEQYDILITDWREETELIKVRRELRENRKNVQQEREKKTILKDETIIPDRTINLNIKRSKPDYVAYVTSAKNALIITDVNTPGRDMESLQLWFTRGMRFPGWKTPWLELIDSMHLHGGAALEVIYDETKPFNCRIDYISRDALILPKKVKDIQACSRILRAFEITTVQLEEFQATYNFDQAAVKKILDKLQKKEDTVTIYRVFCKKQGVVYSAWYSPEESNTWLKAPEPYSLGLFQNIDPEFLLQARQSPDWDQLRMVLPPLPITRYPIFWFRYEVTENQELLRGQGRAAMDSHEQEALTHLLTNTVNATTRASAFYPTAENEPGDDPGLRELGPLSPGIVQSRKISFWQAPWPNSIILSIIQALDVRKAQSSGNQDFAAMARKDANKTATEMNLSAEQSNEQTTVEIGNTFATPYLDVYALAFNIARQQALLDLCRTPQDLNDLIGEFDLQPAGDVEVIRRLEDKNNARQFFEVIRGTPAAEKLLEFLLSRFFPDQADEWLPLLRAPNKDEVILQLVNILKQIPTDGLTPDQQSSLQSIIANAQTVAGEQPDAELPNAPSPAEAGPAAPGNAPA